ncbi:MAG: hypothetical protein ACTSRS_21190 [Candidatus Helarchaeota archaeon]
MRGFNGFKRFISAFEEGYAGKAELYRDWLEKMGIDHEKASIKYVSEYFKKNITDAIVFEEVVETIGKHIGYYVSRRKGLYHVPLIGVKKSGKSMVIALLAYYNKMLEKSVKLKVYNAATFGEIAIERDSLAIGEAEQSLFPILDELEVNPPDILVIDSCDKDKNISDSLKRIKQKLKKGIIITAWTPEKWLLNFEEIDQILPVDKYLMINPLKEGQTIRLVNTILRVISFEDREITINSELYNSLHRYSRGIPGVLIELFFMALRMGFLKRVEVINAEVVRDAAERLGILNVEERLIKLPEFQLLILKQILLSYDERGIRPMRLVELLNKDKATISYHLLQLKNMGLLEVERLGRSSFYKLKKMILPFIELKMLMESEFNA